MKKILDILDSWVEKSPDKLLFNFMDVKGETINEYTYAEFHKRIRVISSHISERKNLKKGDRILLVYPSGLEMICAFFACIRRGLVPVPCYPPVTSDPHGAYHKMANIGNDCAASAILTNKNIDRLFRISLETNKDLSNTFIAEIPWFNTEAFLKLVSNEIPNPLEQTLFLQYTSGSTSEPKGVIVTQKNIIHNANFVNEIDPITVSWLPQYHDMGLIGYYLYVIIKGGTTYGFSPMTFIRNPALWLETITKFRATATSAPNFAFDYCLMPGMISEEKLKNLDLSSLRYLMTAAEPVRPETFRRFNDFFKPYGLSNDAMFAAYGLAENTLAVTSYGRRSLSLNVEKFKNNQVEQTLSDDHAIEVMSCGKPMGDQIIKIVEPETLHNLKEDQIGEVWLDSKSKCEGYWGKPQLSEEMFHSKIDDDLWDGRTYFRTGDMGFMHEAELYICGRLKDMIVIRGLNYYPNDIEKIVEKSTKMIRNGNVIAFGAIIKENEKLIVLAGIKSKKAIPDAGQITQEIRKTLNVTPYSICFVLNKHIPKTSSGKIKRHKAKEMWLSNELDFVKEHKPSEDLSPTEISQNPMSLLEELKLKYGYTGEERESLVQLLDSLDLAILIQDVKQMLKKEGAKKLSDEIDTRLLQEISLGDFFHLITQFESSSMLGIKRLKGLLRKLKDEHISFEHELMIQDSKLTFNPSEIKQSHSKIENGDILLTGGTGFFGPFMLKSLIEQRSSKIHVLVRGKSKDDAKNRLLQSLDQAGYLSENLKLEFEYRVNPILGSLDMPDLGLDNKVWNHLANQISEIYHNGALVNYLFNYEKMRKTNVVGTNEMLKLAFSGRIKTFNHISTTFVFGWATKNTLSEDDTNDNLNLLDFGYSQTKWVSEQLITQAMKKGLNARIFRPALLTPSVTGEGNNFDISIRLMAFMIKYGIGVKTKNQVSFMPADVAANNIVAIARLKSSINKTFHVTRDKYSHMAHITNIISDMTDVEFKYHDLRDFVPEVISTCQKDDLLFPLMDFLVRSVDKISSMEFKRYDNSNYQNYRSISDKAIEDPTLEETVRGLLLFMRNHRIIDPEIKIRTKIVNHNLKNKDI